MKVRLLALLPICCFLLFASGCEAPPPAASLPDPGSTQEAPSLEEQTPEIPSSAEADDGTFRVGVFYYSFADLYISTVRPFLEGALDEAGCSYQIFDAGNNQMTQNEQIDLAVSSGYDLLIVNLVTSGHADVAKEMIGRAGDIPIIFFNRAIEADGAEGSLLNAYENICFIGTDPAEAGHLQGQMIGTFLLADYDAVDLNHDGRISYAMFKGEDSNVEAIYRTLYSVEDANALLADAGRPPLFYFDSANEDRFQVDLRGSWSEQAAFDYMSANLSQYNTENRNMIELIICNNDDMARGAIGALEQAGFNTGNANDPVIPVFGVDATADARALISEGRMAGTVKQDAEGMAQAIANAARLIGDGTSVTDTLRQVADASETFSIVSGIDNKLIIDYAPYTGE